MNNKSYAFIIPLYLGITALSLILILSANQGNWDQEEMEEYLRTAEIVSVEKGTQAGRTAPWRVTLDDGKTRRPALFKHINRPRPSLLPDSYKYEIAAYQMNRFLDLNIVPPIVTRKIDETEGSLQLFLEGWIKEIVRKRKKLDPPDPEAFHNMLEVINVFENLVHDEDCFDADDTLIHFDDWKVCRVDFSMAFSPVPELIPGCRINRCSHRLFKSLLHLDDQKVKSDLLSYLNEEEIEALIQRKRIIIEKIEGLIEERGQESVLFQ
jgi:hypothetical protein